MSESLTINIPRMSKETAALLRGASDTGFVVLSSQVYRELVMLARLGARQTHTHHTLDTDCLCGPEVVVVPAVAPSRDSTAEETLNS